MFGKVKERGAEGRRSGIVSVIGADVVVSGDVAAVDELRVDGRIEGDVSCGRLDMGESGTVAGNIEAEEARIAGTVEGRVAARSVLLEASARVSGDVAYETLGVAAGARVEGRLSLRDGAAAEAAAKTPRRPAGKAGGARTGGSGVAELFPAAAE